MINSNKCYPSISLIKPKPIDKNHYNGQFRLIWLKPTLWSRRSVLSCQHSNMTMNLRLVGLVRWRCWCRQWGLVRQSSRLLCRGIGEGVIWSERWQAFCKLVDHRYMTVTVTLTKANKKKLVLQAMFKYHKNAKPNINPLMILHSLCTLGF